MSDVRFSNGVILPHTALKFEKQLPAFVARVVVEDLRTGDYDDTVVIPERTQIKEESPQKAQCGPFPPFSKGNFHGGVLADIRSE
jgi:hypothetical protein